MDHADISPGSTLLVQRLKQVVHVFVALRKRPLPALPEPLLATKVQIPSREQPFLEHPPAREQPTVGNLVNKPLGFRGGVHVLVAFELELQLVAAHPEWNLDELAESMPLTTKEAHRGHVGRAGRGDSEDSSTVDLPHQLTFPGEVFEC